MGGERQLVGIPDMVVLGFPCDYGWLDPVLGLSIFRYQNSPCPYNLTCDVIIGL